MESNLGFAGTAGTLLIVIGISFFFYGLLSIKRKNLIEITPTSKIRSIALGLVEISGKVAPYKSEILKSPLAGTECVYYRYEIKEWNGENDIWKIIKKGQKQVRFLLQDDTGSVVVDPTDAQIDIPISLASGSEPGIDPPPHVVQFLNSDNIKYKGFLGRNKRMQYLEYLLVEGEILFVMGGAIPSPLAINGDKDNDDHIIIQKNKSPKIFYISNKGERIIILKSLHSKIINGIVGGSISLAAGIGIFIWYFITINYGA